MKNFYLALLVLFVGCSSHTGTLKACRADYLEFRERLLKGTLQVVQYSDPKKNDIIEEELVKVTEAAIINIDTALGVKTALPAVSATVAPVTSGE